MEEEEEGARRRADSPGELLPRQSARRNAISRDPIVLRIIFAPVQFRVDGNRQRERARGFGAPLLKGHVRSVARESERSGVIDLSVSSAKEEERQR